MKKSVHWNILALPQQGDTGWPADRPGWEIHPPTVQTYVGNKKGLNYCTLWSWKGIAWHLTETRLFKPAPGTAFPAAGGWTERHGWWRFSIYSQAKKGQQFPNFLKALWLPPTHLSPKFDPLSYQKAPNYWNTGRHLDSTCDWPIGGSKICLNIPTQTLYPTTSWTNIPSPPNINRIWCKALGISSSTLELPIPHHIPKVSSYLITHLLQAQIHLAWYSLSSVSCTELQEWEVRLRDKSESHICCSKKMSIW